MIRDYIKIQESYNSLSIHNKPFLLPSGFSLDVNRIIKYIQNKIPVHLFKNLDKIIVVHLKDFDERNINALYKNKVIYVTPNQSNEKDMVDDIVHELAHNLEEIYYSQIYGDNKLRTEFLDKRKELLRRLEDKFSIDLNMRQKFHNEQFDAEFDNWLYDVITYEIIEKYIDDLFVSPYAVTSLREYWGNGFENFVMNPTKLYCCPILKMKVEGVFHGRN